MTEQKLERDYIDDYFTLGLDPKASKEECRSAYKKLAQTWHPDRFEESSDERTDALHKFLAIKQSFQSLSDFHKANNRMPLCEDHSFEESDDVRPESSPVVDTPVSENPPYATESISTPEETDTSTPPPPQQQTTPYSAPKDSSAPITSHANTTIPQTKKRGSTQVQLRDIALMFILVGATTYYGVSTWIEHSRAEAEAALRNAKKSLEEHILQEKEKTKNVSAEIDSQLPSDADALSDTSPAKFSRGQPKTFTFGDTMQQILAVQGPPDTATASAWYYGKSVIYFKDGKVSDWKNSAANPLNTRLH